MVTEGVVYEYGEGEGIAVIPAADLGDASG